MHDIISQCAHRGFVFEIISVKRTKLGHLIQDEQFDLCDKSNSSLAFRVQNFKYSGSLNRHIRVWMDQCPSDLFHVVLLHSVMVTSE